MKKIVFLVILLCKNVVYGLENGFYWTPSGSYGALYSRAIRNEELQRFTLEELQCFILKDSQYSILKELQRSTLWSWACVAGQYQFSEKFAINLTANQWRLRLPEPGYCEGKWSSYLWGLVAKHYMPLSKTIQPYGQWGAWYANAASTIKDMDKKTIKPICDKGSGFIVGAGVYFKISKIFIDLSYKRLQPLHLWHKDLLGTNIITISCGIHIF